MGKPKPDLSFLHAVHTLRRALRPVIVSQEMQRTVNNQSCHLLCKAYVIVTCLLLRAVKIHVDLAFKSPFGFERKRYHVGNKVMLEKAPVDRPATPGVKEYNRNPPSSRSHHSSNVRLNWFLRYSYAMMRIDDNHVCHQRAFAVRFRVRLRVPSRSLGEAAVSSKMVSVSERAIPESMTSGPSFVKSPDSSARSTLA